MCEIFDARSKQVAALKYLFMLMLGVVSMLLAGAAHFQKSGFSTLLGESMLPSEV